MPSPKDSPHPDLRARWKHLYATHLPALALARDPVQPRWPIHLDHCFARIILDNAIGLDRPWNQVIKSPAVRNMTAEQLRCALELGERVAGGEVDLVELDGRSLELRGKGKVIGRKGGGRVVVGGDCSKCKTEEKRKKAAAGGEISKYFAPAITTTMPGESLECDESPANNNKRVKLEEEEEDPKGRKEESATFADNNSPTNKNDDGGNNNNDNNSNANATTSTTADDNTNTTAQIARIASTPTLTPFRKQTLTLLCQIPRGRWSTYQALSDHISATSHKTCARAVGNAMRNNPFAPLVPCHRILSSDGSIGGFGGQWGARGEFAGEKRELLGREGVVFDSGGKVRGLPFREFGG